MEGGRERYPVTQSFIVLTTGVNDDQACDWRAATGCNGDFNRAFVLFCLFFVFVFCSLYLTDHSEAGGGEGWRA